MRSLTAADARRNRRIGLVLLDLDHFKIVNDSLGLTAGDELFAVVAQRVERILRAGDTVGASRRRRARRRVQRRAGRAGRHRSRRARAIRARRTVRARDRRGVPRPRASASRSRTAPTTRPSGCSATRASPCSRRSSMGRGRIEVFAETMREHAVARLEMESALRRALVHEEFRVHYQPLVRFESSEVIGLEALLRWQHPERGLGRARRVPRGRRGHRADRADRRVGVARSVRAGRDVGRGVDRPRAARGVGEPLGPPARRRRPRLDTVHAALDELRPRSVAARARDHRDDADGRPRARGRRAAPPRPSSACASASTTSAPASRRSRISVRSRCTR